MKCNMRSMIGAPNSPGAYSMVSSPIMGNSNQVFNSRKQREFIPDAKKDDCYWDRRKRNNEAAKRSREKRRISDMVLETRVLELTRENTILKAELFSVKEKFGLPPSQAGPEHFANPEAVTLALPENAHRGRRNKLLSTIITGNNNYVSDNNNHNGSLTTYASSSSPTSLSCSSSEHSTSPTNINILASSSPTRKISPMSTMLPRNGNTSSFTHSYHNTSSHHLPHKLRHKARNTRIDSDSGSDSGIVHTEGIHGVHGLVNGSTCNQVALGAVNGGNINVDIGGSVSNDVLLRAENYALRNELQRLSSEVASLKTVLVCNPGTFNHANGYSSTTGQCESRATTPGILEEGSTASDTLNDSNDHQGSDIRIVNGNRDATDD